MKFGWGGALRRPNEPAVQPKPVPYCGAVTEQSSMSGVAASPLAIVKLAEQHAQRLVAASNSYSNALAEFVPALHRKDCHPAYLVVGAVCLNDFNDLLFDAVSGRGRSAHRSARTVFEHLLNLVALREPSHRTRFMRHTLVGTQLAVAWNPIELHLSGKALKASRHRQMKLRRDSRKELEEAIAEYGAGFRRQWHPETARDRAVAAGLEREYEFFRAASAAVHGAASAMEDAFWVNDGDPVIRVGPSVVLCPAALAAGLQFMKQFFRELRAELGVDTTAVLDALERVSESIVDFCAYTNSVEEYLFAADGLDRPPVGPARLDV